MTTETFDEKLNDDQRRRAEILRRMHRPEPEYVKPDPPAPGKVERFDDIFDSPTDIARSSELRRMVKAQLYWAKATQDERLAIRQAVVSDEPYRGNDDFTRHFMRRRLRDIIGDEKVLLYIQRSVLGLI